MVESPLRIDPTDSDFRSLREDNLLYVDKTARIVDFLAAGKYLLFTRPRRFGKSLLLSTIEAMYSGDLALFRGEGGRPELAVYREGRWDWPERIVLCLDMLALGAWEDRLAPALNEMVATAAVTLDMEGLYRHTPRDPARSLINLIHALGRQSATVLGTAKIVILVDEYDAPILNHMHRPQGAVVRQELADFYGVFKSLGHRIERLVLTGVTRFVKAGLWSRLNQVRDLSESLRLHDLTGFTDTELDVLWDRVQDHEPPAGWSDLSREAWREWYSGYRFAPSATEPLYNPLAIMYSLDEGTIGEYWSQTGHLGVVERRLQVPWHPMEPGDRDTLSLPRPAAVPDYNLRLDWLDNLESGTSPEAVLAQWQPGQLVPLLYQTGYLTLTPDGRLVPPNREVATCLSRILLEPWMAPGTFPRALECQARMVAALQALDLPVMMTQFNALLHLIPHQRFRGAEAVACHLALELAVLLSRGRIRYLEGEKSGGRGDADTVIGWDDIVMVLEFKSGIHETVESGQTQIQDRGYLQSVPQEARLYLGLAVHTAGRQVAAWLCQGYSPRGIPRGTPLTHRDAWPSHKAELYRRWAVASGTPSATPHLGETRIY